MHSIEIRGLTKLFGGVTAVDDLSFTVEAGTITGFLGPNGAGKTTTLRALLGLIRPDAGTATIDGVSYAELDRPAVTVGAVLEAVGAHSSRTARNHLRVHALGADIDCRRVDELLGVVGLADAAERRVGGLSLGMRQRLSLATALLGDPRVLVLDEPTNGLDPGGVRWLRDLLRRLASEGRAVLVSSHLLAEMTHTIDRVVIVNHGRLVRSAPLAELSGPRAVAVRTPHADRLRVALDASGIATRVDANDVVVALGATPEVVGRVVARTGLVVYELRQVGGSLEDSFLALTDSMEGTR